MRAVDANVLVRLLTRDDAKQTAAADAFVSRGAWVSQEKEATYRRQHTCRMD